jgi:hypothetical protein
MSAEIGAVAQWAQCNRLRTSHIGKRAAVFGAIRDQHEGAGLRHHSNEFGQHGVTGVVDPVHVFDDVDRRLFAGHRRRIEETGQSSSTRIGLDGGHRGCLVGDTQQVVQQQQVIWIGGRNHFANACAGLCAVHPVHVETRT